MAKLLCTWLDYDELFTRCKALLEEKKDSADRVEGIVAEKDELAKVVADLEVRLKELKSKLEASELWATKVRETSKEFEKELTNNNFHQKGKFAF